MDESRIMKINMMLIELQNAMKCCSSYKCIQRMIYKQESEEVEVTYINSTEMMKLYINVACDSYEAIIHDVYERCYKFFC